MKNRILVLVLLLSAVSWGATACHPKNSPTDPPDPPPALSYTLGGFFGSTGATPMGAPVALAVSDNTIWVSNDTSAGLQAWTPGGTLSRSVTAYSANPNSASLEPLVPFGVGVGPDGDVYAGDTSMDQVVEFTSTGGYVNRFAETELNGSQPSGIVVTATDAYVCSFSATGEILHYTIAGTGSAKVFTYQNFFGNSGAGALNNPRGICLSGGTLWVADSGNGRLVGFSNAGVYQNAVTLPSSDVPEDVAADSSGNLFAVDHTLSAVQVLSPSGGSVTTIGIGNFENPLGCALDSQNNLYVADQSAQQVVVFLRN